MDNIQKLVFGVIGIAGLATFLASGLPSAPRPAELPVAPSAPVAAPVSNPDQMVEGEGDLQNEADTAEEDGEDVLAMGEPVIDGQPYGARAQAQSPNEYPQQMDYGQTMQMPVPYNGQIPQQNYAVEPNYMPQQQIPQQPSYVQPSNGGLIQ